MTNKLLFLLAFGLTAASAAAQAQTYDLDITMTGVQAAPITFVGSFAFNANGNGFCSAPFCATGVTPDFSSIHVSDPALGGNAFTAVSGESQSSHGGTLSLVDFLGGSASADSSEVYMLNFNFGSPLGGKTTSIALSDITLETSPNITGIFECGTTAKVNCTTATLKVAHATAPEIDPASAGAGLTLLVAGLAVMRGRREKSSVGV
jgi:hypothetical protein